MPSDPRNYNNLQQINLQFTSGLHLAPSRLYAPPGSLSSCRNWEVVDGAYEESQGLTMVGPTLSEGLLDFWHADLSPSDCAITGSLAIGDDIYWYAIDDTDVVAGVGRIYYAYQDASNIYITIDRVTGVSPRRAKSLYTTNGAEITITSTGDSFVHQSNLGLTWTQYVGNAFLGSMVVEQAVEQATWDAFKPDPLGVKGISGVFQLNDNIFAVRDFFCGKFKAGANEPNYGDEVEVDVVANTGTFKALVGGYRLDSGSWEAGSAAGVLYLYPSALTELDMSTVDNWDEETNIVNNTAGVTLGTALATGNTQYENKGLLWKFDKERKQGGWSLVDLGYSMSFKDGTTAPLATVAPLLVTDAIDSVTDTGATDFVSPATEFPTSGTYSAWSNLGNVDSSTPGVYASTTLAASDYSRVMTLNIGDGLNNVIEGDAKVLGIQVDITCHQTAGSDVTINKVQLRNNTTGASQYLSANRSENDVLNATPGTVYSYGSQLDTWELDKIEQDDINAANYELLVQFYDAGGSARTVNVDLVQFTIHYALQGQSVYFYDGTSDVSQATMHAYQVFDGEWSTDNAEGWMTLYDITDVNALAPGLQIRSAAAGAGDLIATTRTLSKNYLPGLQEMDDAGTLYQSRRGTFSGNEDSEAVYVCTGVGPAFTIDRKDKFSYIRLPIDRDKDKPRYVEIHRNHLALATGSHLLVSSVGSPNNFNTYDGATTWSLKDEITGLAAAPNGTTMVTCKDSVHTFTGSGATGGDAFGMRILTDNSGGRHYTLTNLLGNIFVDYAGITTADVSDKYGGFELGRRSGHIRPLLEKLLGTETNDVVVGNRVVAAIPVRKKNQYRIYLTNGDIITATFPENPGEPIAYTLQNYTAYYENDVRGYEATFVPTSIDSSVLSNGEESIVMGTRLGHVMRVDPKYMDILSYANKSTSGTDRRDTLQTWKPFKYLDITPLRADDGSRLVVFKVAEVYIEHAGYTEINRLAKTDYQRIPKTPVLGSPELAIGNKVKVGDYSDFPGTQVDDYFSWYLDESTDGLSMRLSKFGGIGSEPTRVTNLTMHFEPKGPGKNRIHSDRGYEIVAADLPQDIFIVGTTGVATASGVTGTVALNFNVTGATANATAAGGSGGYAGAPAWTWDDTTFKFDSTPTPTFDGTQ